MICSMECMLFHMLAHILCAKSWTYPRQALPHKRMRVKCWGLSPCSPNKVGRGQPLCPYDMALLKKQAVGK